MPFKVRAISVDNGAEFMAEFEQACATRGIRLFVLPPRSPKLHGTVERANRTHTEECYEPRLPHPRRVPGIPGDRCVTEVPDENMRLPGCLDWGSADARVRPRQRLARSAGFTSLSSGADTATRCAARDPWRPDRYTRTDMPLKHPATQHHLTAAEHHTQAAKSHHLAAVHHEAGDHEAAKKHATAAHASSTTAHGHSTTARDASHKS